VWLLGSAGAADFGTKWSGEVDGGLGVEATGVVALLCRKRRGDLGPGGRGGYKGVKWDPSLLAGVRIPGCRNGRSGGGKAGQHMCY
jgi:hypothetical protein